MKPLILSIAIIPLLTSIISARENASLRGAEKDENGVLSIPILKTKDIKAVYQVSDDAISEGMARALKYAEKLLDTYNTNDIPDENVDLHLVFHGKGTNALVDEKTRKRLDAAEGAKNPNISLIESLIKRGVSIELCESSMEQRDVTSDHLIDGVRTVKGAFPRLIDLQLLGYPYIKFE